MNVDIKEQSIPSISEEQWINHFTGLHSMKKLNTFQEKISNELDTRRRNEKIQNNLDSLLTESEIKKALKKARRSMMSKSAMK